MRFNREHPAVVYEGSPQHASFPPARVGGVGTKNQNQTEDDTNQFVDLHVEDVLAVIEVNFDDFQHQVDDTRSVKSHSKHIGYDVFHHRTLVEHENESEPILGIVINHAQGDLSDYS